MGVQWKVVDPRSPPAWERGQQESPAPPEPILPDGRPRRDLGWIPDLLAWGVILTWLAAILWLVLVWATRTSAVCGS
jgi:hypothetical protein